MTECNRKDLAEILILALPSSKMPEKAAEILAHAQECPHCKKELDMYANLQTVIREHRDELAPVVSDCPDADALVRFASSVEPDPVVQDHVAHCCDCQEQVEILRKVMREPAEVSSLPDGPTEDELRFLRGKVVETYGTSQRHHEEKPTFLERFFSQIFGALHVPSLALGAAVAALLLICVWPRGMPEQSFRLALSDMKWPAAEESMSKSDHWLEPVPESVKQVGLVILDGRDKHFAQKEIDAMYEGLSLQDVLGPSYAVMSPSDLKHDLAGSPGSIRDVSTLWSQVQSNTRADYFIAVQIAGEPRPITVKASLFSRGERGDLGSITQTGITVNLLPERIKSMAADLIAQAQPRQEEKRP